MCDDVTCEDKERLNMDSFPHVRTVCTCMHSGQTTKLVYDTAVCKPFQKLISPVALVGLMTMMEI
jgi:hypothetical protein